MMNVHRYFTPITFFYIISFMMYTLVNGPLTDVMNELYTIILRDNKSLNPYILYNPFITPHHNYH